MIKQQTLKKNIAEYTDAKIKKTGKNPLHRTNNTTIYKRETKNIDAKKK